MHSPNQDLATIELTARQAQAAQVAIRQWSRAGLISDSLALTLKESIQVREVFDWQKFAKYSFRLAVMCLAVAVFSVVFDDYFRKLIKRILELPAVLRSSVAAAGAVAVHVWAYRRSLEFPEDVYLNEAIHALGALLFILAAFQLGQGLGLGESARWKSEQDEQWVVNWLLFSLSIIYLCVGLVARTNFIWSCGMYALGTWFGAVTGYISGMGCYFLFLNYPARFVIFGLALVGIAYVMREFEYTAPLWSSTRTWGLLYHFLALWTLSLFGNDALVSDSQREGGQVRRFVWSFSFFIAAAVAIWHGLRFDDSTTKGFGLSFLGINLYTKLFETFWHRLYKPLFFMVLAGTLAIVGRYAENVWNLNKVQ